MKYVDSVEWVIIVVGFIAIPYFMYMLGWF